MSYCMVIVKCDSAAYMFMQLSHSTQLCLNYLNDNCSKTKRSMFQNYVFGIDFKF